MMQKPVPYPAVAGIGKALEGGQQGQGVAGVPP